MCFLIRVVGVFHIVELEFGIINIRIPPKSLARTSILLYDNYSNTQCLAMGLRVVRVQGLVERNLGLGIRILDRQNV